MMRHRAGAPNIEERLLLAGKAGSGAILADGARSHRDRPIRRISPR